MSSTGRTRRLARIQSQSDGRIVVLPLDLAVPLGPVEGASDQIPLVRMAGAAGVDAVLLRWGEARRIAAELSPDVGLIVRLSGTAFSASPTPDGLFHTVEASLALGADGVCVDLKLGHSEDLQAMRDVAGVCETCDRLGMVCLVEAMPTGAPDGDDRRHWIPAAARVAQELGADIVKVPHPGSREAMREVTDQCQLPVIVAGGEPIDVRELLRGIAVALDGGAAGTAIGRNVITSVDPQATQSAIIAMVHDNQPPDAAILGLKEATQLTL